jgi:hypothetical protein
MLIYRYIYKIPWMPSIPADQQPTKNCATKESKNGGLRLQLAIAFIQRLGNEEAYEGVISIDGPTLSCKPFQGYTVIAVWQDIANFQLIIE